MHSSNVERLAELVAGCSHEQMTDAGETTELIDDIALENVLRNAVEHVDSDVPVVSLCFPQAATPE